MHAYVGSRTSRERNARGDGISIFKMDAATGGLALVQVVGDLVNPSFHRRPDIHRHRVDLWQPGLHGFFSVSE